MAVPVNQRWSRRFPGTPEQATRARHWIAGLLPPGPARDDLLTITAELTANAVTHTRSGHPSGTFDVTLSRRPGLLRLTVSDQGSPSAPALRTNPDATTGRGLLLVSNLAPRWGVTGDEHARHVWADVPEAPPRP